MTEEDYEAKSFKSFVDEFGAMVDDASRFGVRAIVILLEENPLDRREEFAGMKNCGPSVALGMLRTYQIENESEIGVSLYIAEQEDDDDDDRERVV